MCRTHTARPCLWCRVFSGCRGNSCHRGTASANQVLWGFLALFFISGSANISNDYFDRDVDRINLPTRPLPSGRISVRELWILFFLFTTAGLAAAALLGPLVLALVAVFWGIALLYNMKFKEYGVFGNLIVATCVG
ncbi:MAG TPA: UbiA family prenyltransferase [Methanoregula sp.]|nr:UbiA family prenyltransferase [Methanoregula sp.]